MKERPILFNAEMVKAILSGRKTQTRRVMKDQPTDCFSPMNMGLEQDYTARWYTPGIVDKHGYLQPAKKEIFGVADEHEGYECPIGAIGDQLWVRETFAALACGSYEPEKPSLTGTYQEVRYFATDRLAGCDAGVRGYNWRPSIHMPRWASRINLLITGVRVERLQDISQEDAQAEGFELSGWVPSYSNPDNAGFDETLTPYDNFAETWESIYGQRSWLLNPWVWVIEFEHLRAGGQE